ncbi:uncharacterized protein TRAVEDRAFT_46026 [Trametes versicolor FP-101664 SS1]|uniref:uncharacterized protein n=1 Tax=Trametes versicolor (strain FP-101664) TaxID=717944 RepID=UPI0004623B17|nr:uncharacterized protein TRAVEDRAFT_46026 [Trametes versicolor FP-101664 SS1]EIW60785.1 hypothetical protein TRAVEDRAFT_46026 [Trametes versicolor FP-101664 SS1]
MSVPSLQEFNLRRHLFSPLTFTDDPTFFPPPLTAFRYSMFHGRSGPRVYHAETEALGFILGKLRDSLETLALPNETAPYHVLAAAEWPRLRSLELYGDAPVAAAHDPPVISVLQQMPQLRSFCLKLACDEGQVRRVLVWPPDADVPSIPILPSLEVLTVTYPSPQDQLYSRVSSSIRSLSLDGFTPYISDLWPQRYDQRYLPPSRRTPVLPASEMLAVLGHCRSTRLHTLKIEYYVDFAEDELISTIAAMFPDIEFLRLCRYRAHVRDQPGEPEAECADVHSDAVHAPNLLMGRRGWEYFEQKHVNQYEGKLRALAARMVETLAPTVQTIAMLVPSEYSASQPCWTNFRILRDEVKNTEDGGPGGPDFPNFSVVKDGYERDYSWPEESI